jgi:hypothetical protein
MAVSLAALLISCSATRSSASGPMSPRDLAKYAIVFEQQQDGQVMHAWVPLEEFDLTKFQQTLSTINIRPNIVRISAIDPAIDWIKKHREELAVGSVVVIAGVAFAVIVVGSGGAALALAPLLIIAEISPEVPPVSQLAEACR